MTSNYIKHIKSNFFIVILLAWLILPVLSYSTVARIAALIAFLIFIIKYNSQKYFKFFLVLSLFVTITFFLNSLFSNETYFLRHLQLYIFLFLAYPALIIYEFKPEKKRTIYYIILLFNLIAIGGTVLGLFVDNNVARVLAKNSLEAKDLTEQGIGGYGIVYLNVLFIPILLYTRKTIKTNLEKILVYANLIGGIILILFANYLIAILLVLLQGFMFLILIKNFSKIILIIMFSFLFVLIFFSFLDFFDRITYTLVENSNLRYKQIDFFNAFRGGTGDYDTISGRMQRYTRSLALFFENPIVGTLSFDNIGKHSNILDQFAQFGIIFGGCLMYILFKVPKQFLKYSNDFNKKHIIVFIISLILLGLLNNYSMTIGVALILLACVMNKNNANIQKKV